MNKKLARLKRARRFRARNRVLGVTRLVVNRTILHTYAQLIRSVDGKSEVLASAASIDKDLRSKIKGNKIEQATFIGNIIADRGKKAGIDKVAFDRSGSKYHGRVKALAEAARSGGLVF